MKREEYIDLARGIAVILVIICHIGVNEQIRVISYAFHVPIFFIISGYFFKNDLPFKDFLKKKIKSYIYPYIFFSILIIVFTFFDNLFNIDITFDIALRLLIQRRCTALWFLPTLFFANLFFYFISKKCHNKIEPIMICSIIISLIFIFYEKYIINGEIPWNIDLALVAIFFVAVGYFIKQKDFLTKLVNLQIFKKILCTILFIVLGSLLTFINYTLGNKIFDMCGNLFGNVFLTFPSAVLLSIGVILLCSFINIIKPINYIGKKSLIYFGLHQQIGIQMGQKICETISNIFSNNIYKYIERNLLVLIFTLIICWCFDVIINNTKLKKLIGK